MWGSRTLKLEPRTRYCDCHCVGELTNPTRDSTPSRPWLRRLNTFPKSCKEGVKWDLSPNQLLKSSVLFIIHPWKAPRPFSVYREKSTFSRKTFVAGGVTQNTRWRHYTTADFPRVPRCCADRSDEFTEAGSILA